MNRMISRSVRVAAVALTTAFVLVAGAGIASAEVRPELAPMAFSPISADTAPITTDVATNTGVAPKSLVLDGIPHRLVGHAQPRPGYVKTAYLPAGQRLGSHQRMVVVEALVGSSVPEAARVQVELLQERRATDPLVNFDVRSNPRTGEAIVDFTRGGRTDDGRAYVEWTAYRFVPIDQGGVRGVGLFGLSLRAYDGDRLEFARELRDVRPRELAAVTAARIPALVLPVV